MEIDLLRADVSSLKVDAIINPSPASRPPADVDRVAVGDAFVTSGGNVLCKFVIHAIVPRHGDGNEDGKIRGAIWAALKRAEELAIASVALPPLPSSLGFERARSIRVLVSTSFEFRPHARSLQRLIFCAFDERTHTEMSRAIEELSV